MNIELDDSLMRKIGVDEKEALEFLAIALYKYKGIHGCQKSLRTDITLWPLPT
jgi:hypothetical protein